MKISKKILKVPMTLIVIGLLFVGGASGALLSYFGAFTTTVDVGQAITMQDCSDDLVAVGGETLLTDQCTATSETSVDIPVKIVTTPTPDDGGVESTTVEYNLHAEGTNPREDRIRVEASDIGLTDLNSLISIEFDQDVVEGYVGHVDVRLEDKTLVFEYAKVDHTDCDDAGDYPSGKVNTFGNKGIVDSNAYAWISSGPAGPCGDVIFNAGHKSLADWKISDGSKSIIALEFEVDSWIETSTGKMSNLKVNGNAVDVITIQAGLDVVFNQEVEFANGASGTYELETQLQVQ